MRNNWNVTNAVLLLFGLIAAAIILSGCGPARPDNQTMPAGANPALPANPLVICDTEYPGVSEWRQRRQMVECSNKILTELQELNELTDQLLQEQQKTNRLLQQFLDRYQ